MTRSRRLFQLPRRQLLQALGLGVGVGPILPLLNATGAEPTFPKRLLLVFEPDGAPAKDYNTPVSWEPTGAETDFMLADIHKPLEPMKSRLVVPWGLKLTAGGAGENHAFGMAGLWTASTCQEPSANANFDGGNGHHTGWGSGPSIDQVVAKDFGPNKPYQRAADDPMPETLFRTVQLGVECLEPAITNRMIYAGKDQPLHPEDNPKSAFDRLFKGVKPSGSTPMPADNSAANEAAREKAIVDLVAGDLNRLKLRIGSEDYEKVDAHLTSLAALERSLGTGGPVNASLDCKVPMAPTGDGYDVKLKQMTDIAVAALSCDVTRVMSLQWSYGFSHIQHKWIGLGDHHGYSHDGQDRRKELSAIDTWYSQQFLYLLQQLDSVKEGNGTMLDNTLVVIGRELGNTSHNMEHSPILMAGGAGGGLKTGRFLNCDGQEHVKLLVSIGRLMGLDINTFGNRVMNSGPLAGVG